MVNSKLVVESCARAIGCTVATANRTVANLRSDGLMPPTKRGKGAVDWASFHAVAGFAALAIAPTSSQATEIARRVVSLELMSVGTEGVRDSKISVEQSRPAFDCLRDLGLRPLQNLGEALSALLDSMRSGAFAKWAADGGRESVVEFQNDGASATLYFLPAAARTGVFAHFGNLETFGKPSPSVSRLVRVGGALLLEIAAALGPLPPEGTAIQPLP